MAFKPKTVEEILGDAINYVHFNTTLTDFNIGSVIRTILEATSLEDSEQYSQMINILNSFFLKTVAGSALDDRAADFDLVRKFPSPSSGEVIFLDTNLRRSFLTIDVDPIAGGPPPFITVSDVSLFPPTPFLVRLGEGTSDSEVVAIKEVNAADNTLTIDSAATPPFNVLLNKHERASTAVDEIDNLESLVCYVSGEADLVVPAGVSLRSSATNTVSPVDAVTSSAGFHKNGHFASESIPVVTTTLGSISNVPSKMLNKISASPPFGGAEVINLENISGGHDIEGDEAFKDRIREHIAGLSSGTVFSLGSQALQVVDDVNNQRVQRVSVVENFDDNVSSFNAMVEVYIDDGSDSFTADKLGFSLDTVAIELKANDTSIILNSTAGFEFASKASTQTIVVTEAGFAPFIATYSGITGDTLHGISPASPGNYPIGTFVQLVEIVDENTESPRKYYFLDRVPVSGKDNVNLYYTDQTLGSATQLSKFNPKTLSGEFIINEASGQVEMVDPQLIPAGSKLFAVYNVFTGLIALVQKVIDGDLKDPINFPGYRSAGVKVLVLPAKRESVNITINLFVDSSVTDFETAAFVAKQLIISYINNLNIGDDVITSEIIDRVMGVFGVTKVIMAEPEPDISAIGINHDSAAIAGEITVLS